MRYAYAMERKSEYFLNLSLQSKERYEAKVVSAGLRIDPYAIEDWTETPEDAPDMHWSDICRAPEISLGKK